MTNYTQLNQEHCDRVLFKNEMGGKNGCILLLSKRFLLNSSA